MVSFYILPLITSCLTSALTLFFSDCDRLSYTLPYNSSDFPRTNSLYGSLSIYDCNSPGLLIAISRPMGSSIGSSNCSVGGGSSLLMLDVSGISGSSTMGSILLNGVLSTRCKRILSLNSENLPEVGIGIKFESVSNSPCGAGRSNNMLLSLSPPNLCSSVGVGVGVGADVGVGAGVLSNLSTRCLNILVS